ncbi:MAG TPA: hypothetical protein VGK35_07905 [Actinotalea sp.]|jgi:hypothetical protein
MEHRREGRDAPVEYLLIRGRLDRAGEFTPRRCSSTTFVHRWPDATGAEEVARIGAGHGEVLVETVGEGGEVLQREVAEVRSEEVCEPGDARTFRVLAYIGLHPRTRSVRVRREERVLWEMTVPDAPRLAVRLEAPPRRGKGKRDGRPAQLELELSEPADESLAFLTVVHQWGERGYRTVHLGPVERRLTIPVEALPGGRECRLLVTYSNGLRSAAAATDPFELEPVGPSVTILRPGPDDDPPAGVPVVLEGFVEDFEHPGRAREVDALLWTVDGKEVGSGPVTSVDGLEAGRHEVALTYRGQDEARAAVTLRVGESKEPTADQWDDWDPVELG